MRVVCRSIETSVLADHQRGRVPDVEGAYPLTIGSTYVVLGMTITSGVLDFLVQDDWSGPCFAPAGVFELLATPLPPDWHFSLRSGVRASGIASWSDPVVAVWGYPELVEDMGHAAALEERSESAISIFTQRLADATSADDLPF